MQILDRLFKKNAQFNLHELWLEQIELLTSAHILQELEISGKLGITGINGKEYPLPDFENINQEYLNKKKVFDKKREQGFDKILVVPFGMSLINLSELYSKSILENFVKNQFFSTNGALLRVTPQKPLWLNSKFLQKNGADKSGDLRYSSSLITKKQILSQECGWQVFLTLSTLDIPAQGMGSELAHRKQIEANDTPENYLNKLKTESQYDHEGGFTPEAWFTLAIETLQKQHQQIDDWAGTGSGCYLIGSSLKNEVPLADWDQGGHLAGLGLRSISNLSSSYGCRTAVRIY